ncbi:MAG: hypothetical protein M1596_01980 [Firmicutes bacterium]|nr:hypothetical protein [Bacillota bacterium]
MQIAIDADYGYVKTLSSRAGRQILPALIHPAPTTGVFATTLLWGGA